MDAMASRISPDRSVSELAAEITELAGHLNAANYRGLTLIAEFDRCNGWSDWATQSCAHWLNWKCGIDMGAAREKVRVTHALESLPRIAIGYAVRTTQLFPSKGGERAFCHISQFTVRTNRPVRCRTEVVV